MALRWTAAGMLEAEQQFRRTIGYRDLAKLAIAIERDLAANRVPGPTREEAAGLFHHTGTAVASSTTSGTSSMNMVERLLTKRRSLVLSSLDGLRGNMGVSPSRLTVRC
jgi:hypothetical protein